MTLSEAPVREYHVSLRSREHGQRRFVTLAASCPDEAAALCEANERELAAFRLDEQSTHDRYATVSGAFTSPADAVAHVEAVTRHFACDERITDSRILNTGRSFASAGKTILVPGAGGSKYDKAWRSLHEQAEPYQVERVGETALVMAVTAGLYGVPTKNRSDGTTNGSVNWSSGGDTIKCSLHTVTYVPNIDTDDFWNDATNEVTGTGYTTGGATLGTLASSYDTASDQARFDAADTSWTTSTITARIAVVYKSTGTSTTSPLVSFVNFGADVSTTAGTFQITWDATGVWLIDVT